LRVPLADDEPLQPWLTVGSPSHVPQRNVDGRESEVRNAAAIRIPPRLLADVMPDADVVQRVLADQIIRECCYDHRSRAGARGKLSDGLSPADGSVGRLNAYESQVARGVTVVRLRVGDLVDRHSSDLGR